MYGFYFSLFLDEIEKDVQHFGQFNLQFIYKIVLVGHNYIEWKPRADRDDW